MSEPTLSAKRRSRLRAIALVLLILPFAIPLLKPGWIQSHEGLAYPMRLVEVARCWDDGFYSARWFPDLNNGQGYPFLSFYAPLLFFLAGLAHQLGASVDLALKLPVILGAVLGAAGIYRLTRLAVGPAGAMITAALYTYAPYHLRDIFIRGDLAEYLALGFLPWALFAVLRLARTRSARDVLLVTATGALPILTHNILGLFTGVMMVVATVIAVWNSSERLRTALAAGAGGVGTLLLTAFFWIAALYEKQFVQIDAMIEGQYDFQKHFLSALEFVGPGEFPGIGQDLPMTFEMGYPALVLLVLAAFLLRRPPAQVRPLVALGAVTLIAGLVMSTVLGSPIYRALPLLQFVQFPWRFLALFSLGTALVTGVGLGLFLDRRTSRFQFRSTLVAVGILIVAVIPLLGPKQNVPTPTWAIDPVQLAKTRQTTSGVNEYLPIWIEKRRTPRGYRNGIKIVGEGRVEGEGRRVGRYEFRVVAEEPVRVLLQDVYYPGWTATAGGLPLELTPRAKTGNIEFELLPGTHEIQVSLEPTSVRRAGQRISFVTALACVLVLGVSILRRRRPTINASA